MPGRVAAGRGGRRADLHLARRGAQPGRHRRRGGARRRRSAAGDHPGPHRCRRRRTGHGRHLRGRRHAGADVPGALPVDGPGPRGRVVGGASAFRAGRRRRHEPRRLLSGRRRCRDPAGQARVPGAGHPVTSGRHGLPGG